MLIFGCCVGPSGKFETIAGPSLDRVMAPGDVFVREQGSDGICAAYNRVLDLARQTAGCEGVVLLHDDTELGTASRTQVLDALKESDVGLVGVVGGRDLHGPIWVDARSWAGVANDSYGRREYGPPAGDVDVVDGLLLAIAPAAYSKLDFDQKTFPAFHAYDTDYCLQVREAGLRVRVVPVDYRHVDKGDLGDRSAFEQGSSQLRSKWPHRITPLGSVERVTLRLERSGKNKVGQARHLIMTGLKRLVGRKA